MFGVLIIKTEKDLITTDDGSLAPSIGCSKLSKIFQGTDHFPGGELVRDYLFVHAEGVAYFAASLYIYRMFSYPQPGRRPMACSYTPARQVISTP